jgi:hypothetical protein
MDPDRLVLDEQIKIEPPMPIEQPEKFQIYLTHGELLYLTFSSLPDSRSSPRVGFLSAKDPFLSPKPSPRVFSR